MPITKSKILFELDLSESLSKIPRSKVSQAKNEAKLELLSSILADVGASKSPVDGSRFEKLSASYKKFKRSKIGVSVADLRLTSKMLDSIRVANTSGGVKVSILQKKQIPKAFNHNIGDTLPKRQFIPNDDLSETFVDLGRVLNGI